VGEYGEKSPVAAEPEPLIGADEVAPGELGLEPESTAAAADEPSLEDLIARVTGKTGPEKDTANAAPLPESESDLQVAELTEAEPDLVEADADLTEAEPDLVEAEADVPETEANLPELEPELLDPVSDEALQEPALFAEDDFALGEPVEEVAPKKHRAKPRGKPRSG